jgi:DNA-binding transcriptional regulator PaaX
MSRFTHEIVSAEITRLLTNHPDTRYTDIVDLLVLHLACGPSTIRNAITKMRIDGAIVGAGKPKSMKYRLTHEVEQGIEVRQYITKAKVEPTINRPRFTSGIAQYVYEVMR